MCNATEIEDILPLNALNLVFFTIFKVKCISQFSSCKSPFVINGVIWETENFFFNSFAKSFHLNPEKFKLLTNFENQVLWNFQYTVVNNIISDNVNHKLMK